MTPVLRVYARENRQAHLSVVRIFACGLVKREAKCSGGMPFAMLPNGVRVVKRVISAEFSVTVTYQTNDFRGGDFFEEL